MLVKKFYWMFWVISVNLKIVTWKRISFWLLGGNIGSCIANDDCILISFWFSLCEELVLLVQPGAKWNLTVFYIVWWLHDWSVKFCGPVTLEGIGSCFRVLYKVKCSHRRYCPYNVALNGSCVTVLNPYGSSMGKSQHHVEWQTNWTITSKMVFIHKEG